METRKITRRALLKGFAAAGLTAAAAACTPQATPVPATEPPQAEPTAAPTTAAVTAPTQAEAAPTTASAPAEGADNHDVFRPLMPTDQKLSLGFWDSCTSQRTNVIYDKYIKMWNDVYPNVSIDRQHGQSKENYLAAAAAGTPPDVWHGGWDPEMFGNYAINGVIIPLDDYIAEVQFPTNRFLPGALENATMDGKLWGLPEGFALFTVWTHPQQWQEIGHPEPPKDIDEMIQMAQKLTTRDDSGSIKRLGFGLPNWFWPQMGWAAAYGGPVWDKQNNQPTPDNPGVITGLKALVDLAKFYGVDAMDAWNASIGSQSGAQMPYMTGDLSMYIDGNYADQYPAELAPDWVFGKEYGSIAIPFAPKEKQAGEAHVVLWAYPLTISKASKNPRWAFELIRFTQSREYIVPMNVESRDLPAVVAYIKDPRFTNGSAQVTRSILDGGLPIKAALPMHPAAGEYANKLGMAVDEVVHLKKTAEQAMADLKAEIQQVMQETR